MAAGWPWCFSISQQMMKIIRALLLGFFLYMTGSEEIIISADASSNQELVGHACEAQADIFIAVIDDCDD
jgi:hypothetical protein